MGEEFKMSQAHKPAETETETKPEPETRSSQADPTSRPTKKLGLLMGLDGAVHRDRHFDTNALVTYLTHVVREEADLGDEADTVAYSEAADSIVDALEARFEPLVDIQYARRELDETHSDHEISLDDLRTAFDDDDGRAAPGSVELYNDVVLTMLSEFAHRFSAQMVADQKEIRENARQRIISCIVARTDMHDLTPTDVDFAVAEAKRQLESHEVW